MDNREEVRDFLRTRRARITPGEAGVPVYGSQRRVPGLRREEVAMLAGVSIDYYVRLERGNLAGVSESVLDAVAAVLKMDETERRHLADLARTARPATRARRRASPMAPAVPASVRAIVDAITETPALVRDDCMNILATNALARALYAPVLDPRTGNGDNFARFAFLDPASRTFWLD